MSIFDIVNDWFNLIRFYGTLDLQILTPDILHNKHDWFIIFADGTI